MNLYEYFLGEFEGKYGQDFDSYAQTVHKGKIGEITYTQIIEGVDFVSELKFKEGVNDKFNYNISVGICDVNKSKIDTGMLKEIMISYHSNGERFTDRLGLVDCLKNISLNVGVSESYIRVNSEIKCNQLDTEEKLMDRVNKVLNSFISYVLHLEEERLLRIRH